MTRRSLLLLIALAYALAAPPAAAHAGPRSKPLFSMNLYRAGDFVRQYTTKTCVPASMQTMLNMVRPRADGTERTQTTFYRLVLELSRNPYGKPTEKGFDLALDAIGMGRYDLRGERTLERALDVAAAAIARTNRPVALFVWRGTHAWVMHGFTATADPATTDEFRVTAAFVSDPWYPRTSSIWGASSAPNTKLTPAQLSVDYVAWVAKGGRSPALNGTYVLLVPVDPESANAPVSSSGPDMAGRRGIGHLGGSAELHGGPQPH